MDWKWAVPGFILLSAKLIGTSLFVAFIPQIFPRGNMTFVSENTSTVPQTTQSFSEVTSAFTTTEATVKDEVTPKPIVWEHYRGSYYWFSEGENVWSSSRTECKEQLSHLVKIDDEQELEFISNRTKMAEYLIGLTYWHDRKKWLWNDMTEPKRNLFALRPYEDDKECATIRAGQVNAVSRFQESHWICEKKDG